jgi:hypothetical protein
MDDKIETALENLQEASATSLSETTEALEARIAELEAGLSASAESTSSTLEERLAGLRDEIGSRIEAVAEASETAARDLETAFDELVAAGTAMVTSTVSNALDGMPTSGPHRVGETALFEEGKLRAFVAALDRDNKSARLSVNGETLSVAMGETATVSVDGSDCTIGIAAIDAAGVTVASGCDGAATPAAAQMPAPETGFTPGQVALLADGALRVFVSGLAADGSSARIAVNGVETQTVNAGELVDVSAGDRTCTVTVTGVGGGLVALEGSCS